MIKNSITFRYRTQIVLTMLGILIFAGLVIPSPFITALVIMIAASGFSIFAWRLNNYFLTIIFTSFLFRVSVIVVDSMLAIVPSPGITSEHNQNAIDLSIALLNGKFLDLPISIVSMRGLMAYILAPFYSVIGYSPIAGRLAIAFISLQIGYIIFLLAKEVASRQTAVLAASVTLFWPTIVARSVLIQREIVLTVALLAFLWAGTQWLDSVTPISVIIAILASSATFVLRKENLFLIAVMLAFISIIKSRNKPYFFIGFGLVATPLLGYFLLNFGQFTGYGTVISPAALDAYAHGRAHGDAAYLVNLHYETWIDVIMYAPIKVLYYLYTPFPWQIRNTTELIVAFSTFALLGATICARRGIAMLRDKPYYMTLLLCYLVTGIITYSIIEMNYGAAVRRRIQFVPILLLFSVIALSNVKVDFSGSTE